MTEEDEWYGVEERTQPIVAIATASGRGAVGIVRVSGKGLGELIQALVAERCLHVRPCMVRFVMRGRGH